MPEGSGLEGTYKEVSIVCTSVGVGVGTAEAEDVEKISVPHAASTTAHNLLAVAVDP
jgi:hypothetical protein